MPSPAIQAGPLGNALTFLTCTCSYSTLPILCCVRRWHLDVFWVRNAPDLIVTVKGSSYLMVMTVSWVLALGSCGVLSFSVIYGNLPFCYYLLLISVAGGLWFILFHMASALTAICCSYWALDPCETHIFCATPWPTWHTVIICCRCRIFSPATKGLGSGLSPLNSVMWELRYRSADYFCHYMPLSADLQHIKWGSGPEPCAHSFPLNFSNGTTTITSAKSRRGKLGHLQLFLLLLPGTCNLQVSEGTDFPSSFFLSETLT